MTGTHDARTVAGAPQNDPATSRHGATAGDDPSVVLSGEQLRTGAEWVVAGRVRLRRRVVSQTRTIEVEVRREELIIETHNVAPGAVGESYRGTDMTGPAVPGPDGRQSASLVVLLREEVPEVVLHPQVYERVTADVVTAGEMAVWHDNLRHEEADLSTTA